MKGEKGEVGCSGGVEETGKEEEEKKKYREVKRRK